MTDCIFCKIAKGELKSEIIAQNDKFMVLKDNNPQAPVHLLVIPIAHYSSIVDAADNPELISVLLRECSRLGQELGGDQGFRIVVNTGKYGGQTVEHLHFHVLAGRELQWPPG